MKKGEMYKEPYLNDVIFRIDFELILKLAGNNKEAADEFQNNIFEKFPIVKLKKNTKLNFKVDHTSGSLKEFSNEGNLIWIFNSEDMLKEVELSATSLVLHYKKGAYTRFHDFLEDILLLINSLKLYVPFKLKHLGLRYINQIDDLNVSEISEYINPEFIPTVSNYHDNEQFIQCLTKYDTAIGNYLLAFQYGFFNPGYPNPEFNKGFVLDFDCRLYNLNNLDQIKNELKEMNHIIWNKYQTVITEKLEEKMMGVLNNE